jgi:hypothetical protein
MKVRGLSPSDVGLSDLERYSTLVLACCKVGLDRPLIPTAVVANLFRSAKSSDPAVRPTGVAIDEFSAYGCQGLPLVLRNSGPCG